jgi:hypothetical protein
MKHIFTLLFAFMLSSMVAQVAITPGTLSAVLSEDNPEYVYTLTVTNSASTPVSVWWKVGKPTNFPAQWKTFVCDINQCYVPGLEECPASKPNVILGNSTATFTFHLNPSNQVATSKMWLQLYSDKSFKTLVAETDKDAVVVADKLLSIKNTFSNDIKIFPNPAEDYFTIKNDAGVTKVGIYNIVGKEIDTYKHVIGNTYNVSNYVRGLYIVRLIDNRGKTLKSIRLNKR